MWDTFSPFADPNFPQEFARNLHSRFWEMYLGLRLLGRGFSLIPKSSSLGPDFHIRIHGAHVWLEATAPSDGQGPDAVPSIFDLNGRSPVPEDKIILRFASSIAEKVARHKDYVEHGDIGASDAFVIALNGGGIGMTQFEGPLPAIVKSVYPAGDYVLTIAVDATDIKASKIVREGYQVRPQVFKLSGAPVQTNSFLDPSFAGVSGILYSRAALWDMDPNPGCEMLYIDNSVTNAHLPTDWLGMGSYCHKEGNQLRIDVHPPRS
jgi:hypothetical protein